MELLNIYIQTYKIFIKPLTNGNNIVIILFVNSYGEVAQLARALGSYPRCREFESPLRYQTKNAYKYWNNNILYVFFVHFYNMTFKCHIIMLEEKMKINRLFEIVYLLLERKNITAKELAEKFEVSVRTIYRDVEILSSAHIPIYANKGKGGGISLLEDFVLDKTILSEEEQNQILVALQGMEKIGVQNGQTFLDKMSGFFQKSKTNWIDVDLSSWGSMDGNNQSFALVKEAVLACKVLQFVYFNSNGEEKMRTAEPLQIYFKDKAWYLKAFARDRQDYRFFKIARMRNIEILEENFEREVPQTIQREPAFKTVKLVLEISRKMAYRVYDEFEQETINQKANGDFLVQVEFPENDWVYGYILSFGEYAKVIAPEYVRTEIRRKLKRNLRNYLIIWHSDVIFSLVE